jgi:hypothetical protein
VAKQTREHA